eukprot:6184752-Pleurochrysis_carterae.AAC.1
MSYKTVSSTVPESTALSEEPECGVSSHLPGNGWRAPSQIVFILMPMPLESSPATHKRTYHGPETRYWQTFNMISMSVPTTALQAYQRQN